MGREKKRMSRDPSNRSLKTYGETDSREPICIGINIRKTSLQGEREWRSYIEMPQNTERGREEKSKSRILSNRSLKADGEKARREPT